MTFELLLGGPQRTWYTILHVPVDVILFSIRTLPPGFHHLYICHVFPFSFFIDFLPLGFHHIYLSCFSFLLFYTFSQFQNILSDFNTPFFQSYSINLVHFQDSFLSYHRIQISKVSGGFFRGFFIRRVLFGEGYHIPARGCLFRKPFYLMLWFLPLNTYSVSYITNELFCVGGGDDSVTGVRYLAIIRAGER